MLQTLGTQVGCVCRCVCGTGRRRALLVSANPLPPPRPQLAGALGQDRQELRPPRPLLLPDALGATQGASAVFWQRGGQPRRPRSGSARPRS